IAVLLAERIVIFSGRGFVRASGCSNIVAPRVLRTGSQSFREAPVPSNLKRIVVIIAKRILDIHFTELIPELAGEDRLACGWVGGDGSDQIRDRALEHVAALAADVADSENRLIRKRLLNGCGIGKNLLRQVVAVLVNSRGVLSV